MNTRWKNSIGRGTFASAFGARALLVAALAGAAVSACDVHGVSAPGAVASIVVTPNASLAVGGTQQMIAVGYDAEGRVVGITPSWSVAASGGTINTGGMFAAGTVPGLFANTVVASVGLISGSASITVGAGPIATIAVTPTPVTMGITTTQQFTAVAKDAAGNVVSFMPTWSVVANGGTINSTGLFTAGSVAGTYTKTVQASSGAIMGTATVTETATALATIIVSPNPTSVQANGTQQYTALGRDSSGNTVALSPVWSIVNGGGTIGSSTGLFTAGAIAGPYTNTVKATSGSISGTATVTVTANPPALATITITPNPSSMVTNATQQYAAVGRDSTGNVFPITPVWSVANGGGTINSVTGLFTAGTTAGTFSNTVKATNGSVSGTATVVVTAVAAPIVTLGAAAPNGIMAGTAVTCISGGTINANVSISPGNTVTGFGPCVITGVQHLADAVAAQGQIDLTTAYNTLAGMPCPPANAIVGNLGGTTKAAGVYCTASGIGVTGTLTLDGGGDPNATFVFQAGTSLITAGSVVLINGAQAKNVYWQVGSSATLGTASAWQGNILTLTSITLVDNATLLGRALARNGAVSLGTNNVITLP